MTKNHLAEVEKLQSLHKEQVQILTAGFKREVDELKADTQSLQVKLAEMNVIIKSDQTEIQRLVKENQKLGDSYGKLFESSKEEQKRLETELRRKSEQGETILKESLTVAHKSQTVEQRLQQLEEENENLADSLSRERENS